LSCCDKKSGPDWKEDPAIEGHLDVPTFWPGSAWADLRTRKTPHCPAQRRPQLVINGQRLCIKHTACSDMPAVQDRTHRARRASNLYPVHMDITNSYLRSHSDWSETAETSYLRLLTEVPPAVTGLTGKRVNGGCKIAFALLIEARCGPRHYARRHQWEPGSSD
jgi:hypothetical protein